MSDNIQSHTNESKEYSSDERATSENRLCNAEEVSLNLEYKQLFAEKANTTFRELCKTLENEQDKLSELEARRKKLQEEMLLLKAEIQEEKKCLNANIERSVTESLNALNNASNFSDNLTDESQTGSEVLKCNILYTCHEEEENQPLTTRNSSETSGRKGLIEESSIE